MKKELFTLIEFVMFLSSILHFSQIKTGDSIYMHVLCFQIQRLCYAIIYECIFFPYLLADISTLIQNNYVKIFIKREHFLNIPLSVI